MIDSEPKYSEQTIRQFLLGGLDAHQQSAFEYSLFTDDELAERVRFAELELADEYASNRLAGVDRQTFREKFLLTEDRTRLLTISKALYDNLTPAPVVRHDSAIRLGDVFNLRRHVWKYAFAMLLLLLLLTAALLVKKERSQLLVTAPKPQRAVPRPSASQSPRMMSHSNNSPPRAHSETSPALPLHEGLTTSVMLVSGTSLDSSPVISVNGDILTVELMLDQPFAEFYEVNVYAMSGESVFTATELKRNDSETLGFDVPTSALTTGDFKIELLRTSSQSKESAGTYYLRVR